MIYIATLYPLLYWHAHLPRGFTWFVPGDFVQGVAPVLSDLVAPIYWLWLAAFAGRQLWLLASGRAVGWGKVLLVSSTWACWYVGVIWLNSDYAFTVTNVLIHGIPYMFLTYRYGRARAGTGGPAALGRALSAGVVGFLALLLLIAAVEESVWDLLVWHEYETLLGEGPALSPPMLALVVPLLAVPQLTHYVLDAYIWKMRRGNPGLARAVRGDGGEGTV